MERRRVLLALVGIPALAPALLSCSLAPAKPTIRVGSKDFPEQYLIAEMYSLLLEDAGFRVERKLNLGPTPIAHEALTRDQIDLYPEYTGTALLTVLKLPTSNDRQQVYDTVAREYRSRYGLVWLDPAPMNNTQALAMTREGSDRFRVKTISDFVSRSPDLRLVGPPEFADREDGLPGIERTYGPVRLRQYVPVEIGLKYKSLTEGKGDVVVAFGTDGEVGALDLVLLDDDRKLFPPYQIAPVVRSGLLDSSPTVRDALNRLAPLLTDDSVRRLNYDMSQNAREPQSVAREFVTQAGLIGRR